MYFFDVNAHVFDVVYIRIDEILFWSFAYVEKAAGVDTYYCNFNCKRYTGGGSF